MASSLMKCLPRNFLRIVHVNEVSSVKLHTKPMRFPTVSYNEMTKPEGSWKVKIDQMNAEYNRYMYAGLATLCVSLAIAYYSLDIFKYKEPPHRNTPEGLAFLHPDPEVLADIQGS
ncbi:unnamed protein product [Rodentolepis nana]|uniref:Deltameth_res domain-containing protein n=1 Tax=Rodentolepis nana TaxID=102285 RepID=A0A0R3T067_RODNA|nr:unnamed protein product [Rodentolepis nana]